MGNNPYSNYKILCVVVPIITLVVFGVYLFFEVSAQVGGTVLASVFDNRTIFEAFDALNTNLTPPPWNFHLLDLINIWQATWLFFIMGVTYCSTKCFKCPLWLYVLFGLAMILNTIWTVTLTHLNTVGTFIVMTIVAILLIIAYMCSCYHVEYKMSMHIPHWLLVGLRVFLLNGLGLFAAYAFWNFFFCFDIMLVNSTSAAPLTSAVTLLAFMSAFIIIYFALDMTKYSCIFNFVWTPYCVWIWVVAGIVDHYVSRSLSLNYAVAIVAIVLLAFLAVIFVFKVCYTFKRLRCGYSLCNKLYRSIAQMTDDEICCKPKFKYHKSKKSSSPQAPKGEACHPIKVQVCQDTKGDKQTKEKIQIKQCDTPSTSQQCKPKSEPLTQKTKCEPQQSTEKQSQI